MFDGVVADLGGQGQEEEEKTPSWMTQTQMATQDGEQEHLDTPPILVSETKGKMQRDHPSHYISYLEGEV